VHDTTYIQQGKLKSDIIVYNTRARGEHILKILMQYVRCFKHQLYFYELICCTLQLQTGTIYLIFFQYHLIAPNRSAPSRLAPSNCCQHKMN
jgi:hypothetical protein